MDKLHGQLAMINGAQLIGTMDELFPLVQPRNGLYVVEDTHTSYYEAFGGGWMPCITMANCTPPACQQRARRRERETITYTTPAWLHTRHARALLMRNDTTRHAERKPMRALLMRNDHPRRRLHQLNVVIHCTFSSYRSCCPAKT